MSDDTRSYRPWRTDDSPILPPEYTFLEARLDALEKRVQHLEQRLQQRESQPLSHPHARPRNEAA